MSLNTGERRRAGHFAVCLGATLSVPPQVGDAWHRPSLCCVVSCRVVLCLMPSVVVCAVRFHTVASFGVQQEGCDYMEVLAILRQKSYQTTDVLLFVFTPDQNCMLKLMSHR